MGEAHEVETSRVQRGFGSSALGCTALPARSNVVAPHALVIRSQAATG